MRSDYEGVPAGDRHALTLTEDAICSAPGFRTTVHADNGAMIRVMAERMMEDYTSTIAGGASHCTMIVPVGPVGQYDLLAELAIGRDVSLDRLNLIIMDEYLTMDGNWIDASDPLSFRGHLKTHLIEKLPEGMRPTVVVPDPHAIDTVPDFIDAAGGLDFTYAGVGITGHLAFNDPVPGRDDPDWFAALPTRIVSLLPETRLINSVTAARGNIQRIPSLAVTVGMKEILGAKTLRIWMNREWQCAAVRRMVAGPVTGAFPASLAQRHTDVTLDICRAVLALPEPGLA